MWFAVALPLLAGACAIGPAFQLSPQEQQAAEEWARGERLANPGGRWRAGAETPTVSEWAGGECRWTWSWDVVACETRSRPKSGGPWSHSIRRYRRRGDGAWELLPP